MPTDFKVFGVMSLKPSRRTLDVVPKVKLGDLRPLPEPVEEMAVEVEDTSASFDQDHLLDARVALNMLSALQLDGAASGNSTPFLSTEGSFDDVFAFDSADDDDQGRSWQLSGDTGSSDFGNSVTSFMSWTDDVEVETTRKVQDLVNELERCFYGEESLDNLKKEVAAECLDWRSKFPHFRVRGAGIQSSSLHLQRLYEKECMDGKVATDEAADVLEDEGDGEEEEEVIASHGSCQEQLELNEYYNRNDNSRPYIAQDNVVMCHNKNRNRNLSARNLRQKVKDSVMEQLFSYVWSEVSKSLEPLLHFYSESTLQQRPGYPASMEGQSRMINPRLSAIDIPFSPVPDVHDTAREQSASAESLHCYGRRTSICPVLQPNVNGDESVLSQSASTGLAADPVLQRREPRIISLPKPLGLHSANYSLATMLTPGSRGYHSAADGRTRSVLTRRFSSMTSRHDERFLKPVEEQQMMAAKVTTTLRRVSAPTSPPNWSRHVTLPPIDHLDPHLKGLSLRCEPKFRGSEVRPRSRPSAKQKGLHSVCESKIQSPEGSSRSRMSVTRKVSLLPIDLSGPITIQGTGLSKTDRAKQVLDVHKDPSFEGKNGVISSVKDRRSRWTLRRCSHAN